MKPFRFVLCLAVLAVLASSGFAQGESHQTVDGSAIQIGRGVLTDEHVRLVANDVSYVGRHCQQYEHKHNFFAKVFLGRKNSVDAEACAADPSTIFYTAAVHNLRTNAGSDAQSSQMGNTAAQAASCNYIAVTNDATAAGATDTTLASEITTNGLGRAQGVYAHTAGTSSFTVQKVFTATGTQASQKTGLFNASSAGTLCFENTYTQVTVNNGDTLTVTWTINF
jgi:hypothetical protein